MTRFSRAELGRVLRPVERPEIPIPGRTYRQLGVRLWGEGAYERESMDGGATKYSTLSRVRANDVVVNKIWARNGSVAVVPPALDGCYVSGEFPTFEPNQSQVAPEWIHWHTKTRQFWEQCDQHSRGTSGKNRIRPEQFLKVEIPVPPVEEQRRILARIEALSRKCNEIRTLRESAATEAIALLRSAYATVFRPRSGWRSAPVGEFCEPPQYGYTESASREPVGPRFLRITDIQDGSVNWQSVPFCRCPNPEPYLLKPGDLVFARTGATTGKSFVIGECPAAVFASYLIRLRVRSDVSVQYLHHYFQSPAYWEQVADEKKGTGQPNLNGSKLERLQVPIPTPAEQEAVVTYLNGLQTVLRRLSGLQTDTAAQINALLPSILDRAFKGEL